MVMFSILKNVLMLMRFWYFKYKGYDVLVDRCNGLLFYFNVNFVW